jgi:hypothetical protein
MKKKLDLKRRIMLHQLSAAHRDERLQSPFLRTLMEDSRKRKRDDAPAGVRLQAKLQALKTISDKLKQHKQQKQRKAKPAANGKAASNKAKAAAPAGSSSQKKQR